MANIDIMRFGVNNQKKVKSISAIKLIPAVLTPKDNGVTTAGEIAIDDVVELFNIPANCVVTDAYILVEKASTEPTAQLEIKVGTNPIVDSTAVGGAPNVVLGSLTSKVFTGTGAKVTATNTAAALKSGEFTIVVAYDEITRNAFGDFTKTDVAK